MKYEIPAPDTAGVRLRWVWHRYPSVVLPVEHDLVVTHLCWLHRDRIYQLYYFPHDGRLIPVKDTPPEKYKYDPNTCVQVITGLSSLFKAISLH